MAEMVLGNCMEDLLPSGDLTRQLGKEIRFRYSVNLSFFLVYIFFNPGELLTSSDRTSYNRAALQNSPWGVYKAEQVWESAA